MAVPTSAPPAPPLPGSPPAEPDPVLDLSPPPPVVSEYVVALRPPAPAVVELTEYVDIASPTRARLLPLQPPVPVAPVRSRRSAIWRRGTHLVVLAVVLAVAIGGGFWSESQTPVRPGGTDQILHVGPLSPVPAYLVASTTNAALPGYFSITSPAMTETHLEIGSYVTRQHESLRDVAKATGRTVDTLLWANGLTDPAAPLVARTQLRVPPVDGILHVVHDGDTLESIAARYGVEPEAITGYEPNGVAHSADLVPYHLLMVPGGKIPKRDKVLTYTVREGDSVQSIASRFGLSPNTIIWANNLPESATILPGQTLAILPTDGVMVAVHEGDTVESLADYWGVEPSAIRDYPENGLGAGGALVPGSYAMIPGGHPPAPPPAPAPAVADAPASGATGSADESPAPPPAASRGATGAFSWPANGTITQYFSGAHNGWDIANGMYTPIHAADAGTVTFAGWNNYGLGYCVSIDHGNGFVTWYGHMAEPPPVSPGQWVERGEYIGPMGSTGNSTGPHVHFIIVRNGVYQNPGDYLP